MRKLGLAAFTAATLALSFQDSLATLKLTRQSFETNVSEYVSRELSDADSYLALPFMPSASKAVFLPMADATRAAIVKELGLAAKAVIMSPAFDAAYKARLKSQHNAIDHGLKVTDTAAGFEAAAKSGNTNDMMAKMQSMMRDQMKQMVLGLQKEVDSFDASTLKTMAESTKSQMDSIPPTNPAEKAQHAKATTLLNDAMKLSASNLPLAKDKYREGSLNAVYLDAGNPSSAQADQAKKEQQLNYDKRALRPNLKRQLLAFAAEAKTVDFKAATQPRGNKTVFVNAAYERKSPLWKLLFRLGPSSTAAAMALAQSWAAEL